MARSRLVTSTAIDEIFNDFLLSRKVKGLSEKTLQTYAQQFRAMARYIDTSICIDQLQKADLDEMIISMRAAGLSSNSINSYTRTLKSFLSWCNEEERS